MTKSFQILVLLCSLLQLNVLNAVLGSEEQHISACKATKCYSTSNAELICSNEDLSNDIFANTSITETIICDDNNATKTDSINSISFTNCICRRAPIHLFNYFPLQTIDLRSTALEQLNKYDFVDTPYLKKVIAINNSLTTIPANLFQFATAIETLYLSHNQIAVVDPEAFKTSVQIKFLDLRHNNLTKVSKYLLDTLPNLEGLYFSYNNITEIDLSAFSALNRLDALDLEGNRLETLTSDMFTGLWSAFRLNLSYNKIRRINGGAFAGLAGLLTLQLNFNDINSESIQQNAFVGLSKVYRLEMNHNKLTILRNGMFDGIPGLQYLKLSHNQIVAIEPLALDHTEFLEIDLSSNQIAELSSDVFSNAPNMQHVNLSYTNIAEVKADFLSETSKLEVLDLSFCKLKAIDFNHFSQFATTLRSLYVDGNGLTELHSEIREILPKLSDLGLTSNNFSCEYFREIYPSIGAKLLANSIRQHPVASNERNVHGIRCY